MARTDITGKCVGNYNIVSLLGAGAFADVYLAKHVHLNIPRAIKVLHTRLSSDEIEDFLKEARLIASLEHPNIVQIHDYFMEEGAPFLVMDYAPNGTLRGLFTRGIPHQPAKILPYIKQVAAALQYAHEKNTIHRDVKPANILLAADKRALLSDFGLAVILQSSNLQSTPGFAGTLAYMAPEQIHHRPCFASDQYSLAIITYQWLSGTLPFQGTLAQVVAQHLFAEVPSLRQKVPSLSIALEAVVMKALAKEPHERFASVQDFANALEKALETPTLQVSTLQPPLIVIPPPTTSQHTPPPAVQTPAPPQNIQPLATQTPAVPVPPPAPAQAEQQHSPRISRRKFIAYGSVTLAGLTALLIADKILVATHATSGPKPQNTPTPQIRGKATSTPAPAPVVQTYAVDTFHRTDQQLWGKASDGQLWQGAANDTQNEEIFSIKNGIGRIVGLQSAEINGMPATYQSFLGSTLPDDVEVELQGLVSSFAHGLRGQTYFGAMLRWNSNPINAPKNDLAPGEGYKAILDGTSLSISKRKNSVSTPLTGGTVPFPLAPNTTYTLKFQVVGDVLKAKAWPSEEAEPTQWNVITSDHTFVSGMAGIRVQVPAGTEINISSFLVTAPQSS